MMNPVREKRTPCHLVAGPLGVGKTTAILHYLKHKNNDENIAVLVNDFGASGLDGVILEGEGRHEKGGLAVIPVPGGCLCCTSAVHFEQHLGKLAASEDIDRIIIEPSGIVMLDQMKAMLLKLADTLALDVRPVMVLVNVARFKEEHFTHIPYYAMLVRESDILVGNRCDQAGAEQKDAFAAFAQELRSQGKHVYRTDHGQLPVEVFAAARAPASVTGTTTAHLHPHRDHRCTGSLEWPSGTCFNLEHLTRILTAWKAAGKDPDNLRLKATLYTNHGWRLMEIAQGGLHARPFPEQDSNRLDWIAGDAGEAESLTKNLNEAVIQCMGNG